MRVVCDASVLAKLLIPEPDSSLATTIAANYVIVVPEFALLEVTNILWSRVHAESSSTNDAILLLQRLHHFDFDIRPVSPWIDRALALACAMNHPVYDCIYLALAEELDIPLVTADRRFLAAFRRTSPTTVAVTALAEFA